MVDSPLRRLRGRLEMRTARAAILVFVIVELVGCSARGAGISAADLMIDAPGEVDPKQLEELHLQVVDKK